MRLVTFTGSRSKARRLGALAPDGSIVDLAAAAKRAGVALPFEPGDMIGLIAAGRPAQAAIRRLLKQKDLRTLPARSVTLQAPIGRPRRNVFCVGWNYLEHFEEGARARPQQVEMPAHPTFFTKQPGTVNGPAAPVPAHPTVTQKLDWEVELAVVIGRAGINIAEADAMKHVFGYMVANDVSAREIQRQHGQQWFKGKSLDGHCPTGPWIVTADELGDPGNLRLTCRVNGVVKQDASTRQMYFKIPRIIAELSAGLALEPGDVILTGTPSGVGHARTPPEFMRPGDVLETEIESIGTLRNVIAA